MILRESGTGSTPEQGLKDTDQLYQHYLSSLKSVFKIRDKILHYADRPKDSGYRSIHLIVETETENEWFPVLPIEVQIHTECQHLFRQTS
jgi:ppGpp synthetase/RelA/SpoT-type nucleotidyltranferase